MEGPGRQRSRPALHTEGPGGHFCGVQGHRHDTLALESLLLMSSGLPEIPKVEFESFSCKAFFFFFPQDAKVQITLERYYFKLLPLICNFRKISFTFFFSGEIFLGKGARGKCERYVFRLPTEGWKRVQRSRLGALR